MTKFAIIVSYATPEQQVELSLDIASGTSAQQAIVQSGILEKFPEINLAKQKIGVFSRLVSLDYVVKAGDRLEIYRPLQIDPKAARLLRAERQKERNKK